MAVTMPKYDFQKGSVPRKRCRICKELKPINGNFTKLKITRRDRWSGVCHACVEQTKKFNLAADYNDAYLVRCLHCSGVTPLTQEEVAAIVKEAIVHEERLDPDAPIRAIIDGALGDKGAKSLGRTLRKKFTNPETPDRERMRCLELLISCMKHFEDSMPAPADLSRLDRNDLEAMLAKAMRGTGQGGPVGTPTWMQTAEVQPTTNEETDDGDE